MPEIRVSFKDSIKTLAWPVHPSDSVIHAAHEFRHTIFMAPDWSMNFRVERTGAVIEHHDLDLTYDDFGIRDGDVLVKCV